MRYFRHLLLLGALIFAAHAYAQLAQTGAGSAPGGSVPSVCAGALDLSLGCPLPMLGVF